MSWDRSDRSARLPSDWKRRKRAVFRRDGDLCHVCLLPGADDVDHVHRGDDHRLANLAPIHSVPCHRDKTAAESLAARYAIRDARTRPGEPHPLDQRGP